MSSIIINFAPTGLVFNKNDCPFIPIHPNEIIEQIHEAYEIGITLVHVHARDKKSNPTSNAKTYIKIVDGVRQYCKGLPVCVSLSGRKTSDIQQRIEPLQSLPDMGSLTLSSLNFQDDISMNSPSTIQTLCEEINNVGAKPEMEVFNVGMINYAKYLIKKNLIQPPFYFNIFCGNISGIQLDPLHVGIILKELPDNSMWALGGLGRYQFQSNLMGLLLNGGIRIGLEDSLYDHKNTKGTCRNIDKLKHFHEIMKLCDITHIDGKDFKKMGFKNDKISID